jgi:hypothetical protein
MQSALPPSPDGSPAEELKVRFLKIVIVTVHGPLLSADQDGIDDGE